MFVEIYVLIVATVLAVAYAVTVWIIEREIEHIGRETRIAGSLASKAVEVGYVNSRIPFESLKSLSEKEDFLFCWVISEDGIIQYADDESFIGKRRPKSFSGLLPIEDEELSINQAESFAIYRRVFKTRESRTEFWLGNSLYRTEIIRKRATLAAIGFTCSLLLLIALTLHRVVKKLIAPLSELTKGTQRLGQGDLAYRVPIHSTDELGQLGEAFNSMATEIEQASTELASSEIQYRATIDSLNESLFVVDRNLRIILHNQSFAKTSIDHQQFRSIPKDVCQIFPQLSEQLKAEYDKAFASKQIGNSEYTIEGETGTQIFESTRIPMIENGIVTKVVTTMSDITERRKMEEELHRVEKLESIGILAGGIAHDFNNMLSAIIAYVSVAKNSQVVQQFGGEALEALVHAENAVKTANGLTKQFLAFSKGGLPVLKTDSILDLLKQAVQFALSGTAVKVQYEIPSDLWLADFDASQITQVIQNIVINAVQAMPDGGKLDIEAENISLDNTSKIDLLPTRPYIGLHFTDSGEGIDDEIQDKIFDPFFTTKPEGNGLGLASSHRIVERHGGRITVSSSPGCGTTISVYLPAVVDGRISEDDEEFASESDAMLGGRILLVDDDARIRDACSRMIRSLGYDVTTASNGESAEAVCNKKIDDGIPFDLAIVDLTIPGEAGGLEIVKSLKQRQPDLITIVSSGYSDDPVMSQYRMHGFEDVIPKPYDLTALSKLLNRNLYSRFKTAK